MPGPISPLQRDLAQRILQRLAETGAPAGRRLVEEDLCRAFAVSRTPVRGALRLLAEDGVISPRAGGGYVLAAPLTAAAPDVPSADEEENLIEAIAAARETGALPDQVSQQELLRRFPVRAPLMTAVLRRLADLGLVERRAGHGWAFNADPLRAINESYAFRRALEPAMLLTPGFVLDRAWAEKARAGHLALRHKPWAPQDNATFHRLNAEFHEALARCSHNRFMARAVARQTALRRFLAHSWDYPRRQIHAALDDHLEILSALEAGYADKASALMLHHLTTSASSTKLALEPRPTVFSGAKQDAAAG